MAYEKPGPDYYITQQKAQIADTERQLAPHYVDDPLLRPTVTHVDARITDFTDVVVEYLERRLQSERAALARYEAWKKKKS